MGTVSNCSIFLIEDSPADADLIQRVLKKEVQGLRIFHALDGEEALNMLHNWGPELPNPLIILLDLKLPKVDGLTILREIKSNARFRMLPVIVLTSSNLHNDIQTAYALGANSYILKAIDFDDFSKAIAMIQRYWCSLNIFPE